MAVRQALQMEVSSFFKPRLMKVRKKESKKDLFMFLNRTDGVDNVRNRTI